MSTAPVVLLAILPNVLSPGKLASIPPNKT